MLTTNNAAAMSAKDKQQQMLSHVALCPALYLFLMGVISMQFLMPWNAATFVGNSGDWDMMTNSTYQQAWTQYEHQPCSSDEVKVDGKNCVDQIFHPVKEYEDETSGGVTYPKVKSRGDWWNCDLPSHCHMRYMYQEEARNAGIYYIGMGVMAIYALVSKSHYAARATSGLNLFLAVYCILHALALITTYSGMMDRDEQMVPWMYRQAAGRTVTMISALIFLAFGVLNIVSMVFGMMRAGELTANARAANVASSGLVAQFGTAEFNAMDGGNKGKQTVSTAGMCCLGLWVLIPCFYFTWIWSYGVTFKYMGAGDLSNIIHENATLEQGAEFMYNLYPKTKKVDGNDQLDCDGLGESWLYLDTGLKKTGTTYRTSGVASNGPICVSLNSPTWQYPNPECGSAPNCAKNADCAALAADPNTQCQCHLCPSSAVAIAAFSAPGGVAAACGPEITRRLEETTTPARTSTWKRVLTSQNGKTLSVSNEVSAHDRKLSSTIFSFGATADDKIFYAEFQKCKGINKDMGAEHFGNDNDDGPVWMVAYHTIRQQAKLSGAFYWATAIAGFFSVGRGASFAARSVSGLSLGFAVVGALMMLQSILLWYAPDYNKVPQYFRDDTTIATFFGLLFGGIAFALNLVGFIVGIGKTKEVEGAAPAAPAAAMDEPTPEASSPPQAEDMAAADAEAPAETSKAEEAPAAEM